MKSTRAVKSAKRADDRRRSGVGDNVAFTAKTGVSGLGAGKRSTTLVTRTLAAHQFTNRIAKSGNGKGRKLV